jgi:hypothetical protein
VGGRVAEAGPLLFEPLRALVRRYAMAVPARVVRIVPTALGADGILIGAIALAVQSWTGWPGAAGGNGNALARLRRAATDRLVRSSGSLGC